MQKLIYNLHFPVIKTTAQLILREAEVILLPSQGTNQFCS